MSTSDPQRGERGYSATGNATGDAAGPDDARTDPPERTVTGGGDHPAAAHIAADRLPGRNDPPGRAGPHDADGDLDADEGAYSATGNATGPGAGIGTDPPERTVSGGGDEPAAAHIAADRLPGRGDAPGGITFRDDTRDDTRDAGPTDPTGPHGPGSEEHTR